MAKRFHFSLKSLLIAMCVAALLCGGVAVLYQQARKALGVGPYRSFDQWPRSLVALIGDDQSLRDDVVPIGLGEFVDHASIWRIQPGSPLRQRLFDAYTLEATTANHPEASTFFANIPQQWKHCVEADCNWYATPGYGNGRIEGVDLFLIAENPGTGELIVLHEWFF